MITRPAVAPVPVPTFADAMARLVSGVAVVTARHADGRPCGLLVSSICSYSAAPPSLLVVIGRERASHPALVECAQFGVHLLGREHGEIAARFARPGPDKFAGMDWDQCGSVPRLRDVPVFLSCARRSVLPEGDHTIVIGDVTEVSGRPGEPLVYYERRLDWRLY